MAKSENSILENPEVQAAITAAAKEAAVNAVRETAANVSKEYESRLNDLEARNKLKDDPKSLDRLKIVVPKATVEFFLHPENKRPATEHYWVSELENSTFFLPLIESITIHNEKTGRPKGEDSIILPFTIPSHGMLTDFADARGVQKYWVLCGDLVDVTDIAITAKNIADPKLRLKPGIKPRPGRMTLETAMQIVQEVYEHPFGPRHKVFDSEGFRKLMTGEEFRVLAAAKYKERWINEDAKKTMRSTITDKIGNDDKTGAALAQIAAMAGV